MRVIANKHLDLRAQRLAIGAEHGAPNIPEYVECEKYESWEKFFTEILITLTADGVEKYSKNILNSYYLQDWVVDKIKEQLPIEVINK